MSAKSVIVPLESYRLAQYAVPIPCYICESENTFDAEYCTHCSAPMALAHQAKTQGVRPRMLAVVGASGAGKTVYLGMLMDMLSRRADGLQLLARGAFSISLQQTTIAALARCEFPQKTPNEPERWNWVHCQVRRPRQKRPLELIMPDMAGEALLEEIDHPHTYRVIHSFLQKCSAAIVLIDAATFHESNVDHDYFTVKLLTYLSELRDDTPGNWTKKPVALVLSKADQYEECMEDPASYARQHATGLWQQCQERFACHRFFATGVAGGCAWRDVRGEGRLQVPLRIEPRGIAAPFEWVLGSLPAEKG
ncbi:MAG: TRAFAC clade GTPase domain-containing protein [Planctomycetota bacterium]